MFEKQYIDGPPRERVDVIEKHLTIETPDVPRFIHTNSFVKFNPDVALVNDGNVGIIQEIPVDSRKTRKKSKEINEENKSKAPKRKPKKNSTVSDTTAVEGVQA